MQVNNYNNLGFPPKSPYYEEPILTGGSGLVLVFDLDETIAMHPFFNRLNPAVVDILRIAVEGRKTGKVDAILLYTNNADYDYIDSVILSITRAFRTPFWFDNIMAFHDYRRVDQIHHTKVLADVERMLKDQYISTENLPERVYFFDDRIHTLSGELPAGHFIHITPPFDPNKEDKTNYSTIRAALGMIGGRRKNRSTRRKKRRQRKTRKYK